MPDAPSLGRAYAAPERWTNEAELVLGPEESRHIAKALRGQPGQRIDVFDGCGRQAQAEIISNLPGAVVVRLGTRFDVPPERPQLTLIQALPKAQKMDVVIQKAVEIGAHTIQPVFSARVQVHPREIKINRWRRIAQEASRQCEAAWQSEVCEPVPFVEAVHKAEGPLLVAQVDASARPLRAVLEAWQGQPLERLTVCIGPEGGLAPEEIEVAKACGAQAVYFGPRVLRTETAGLFALSAIRYALYNA